MLAFTYVMLSAKPVSLRRLCALFALSTAVFAMILGILRVPHSSTTAVHVALAITFAAWVLPLIRIVRAMRRRAALREMLGSVSIPVQLTYWSSLLLAPAVMVAGLSSRPYTYVISLDAVSRGVALMLIGILLLLMATEVLQRHNLVNRSPVRKISTRQTPGATWHRVVPAVPTRRT